MCSDAAMSQRAGAGVECSFALAADRERCLAAFEDLVARLPITERYRADLRRRYAEPHRSYHNRAHIGLLWLRHRLHGGAADDAGSMLAVAFHDAVFGVTAAPSDNEAASAALLQEAAQAAGLGPEAIAWPLLAIRATTDHLAYAGRDPRVLRFLDLDLTPLAEHVEVFRYNTRALRQEYAHLDDAGWQRHLQVFLQGIRSRAPIFRSGIGPIYEAAALANIDRELATEVALAAGRSGHADRQSLEQCR